MGTFSRLQKMKKKSKKRFRFVCKMKSKLQMKSNPLNKAPALGRVRNSYTMKENANTKSFLKAATFSNTRMAKMNLRTLNSLSQVHLRGTNASDIATSRLK